jgi:ribosomal protein S12 methylthiotransferase accessory factor
MSIATDYNWYELNSSLRARSPEETLVLAGDFARKLGIVRVTDVTRFDRVGVPVYSSIRPTARLGSLCVNAGKGIRPIEAQVGAYMEAIEYALAERGASSVVNPIMATARAVLDGATRPRAILDFAPTMGSEIYFDDPLECVAAEELITQQPCFVPAELVFIPYNPPPQAKRYFGSSTNGLASGNTILEATIHATAELLERDIVTFKDFGSTYLAVDATSLPPVIQEIQRQILAAGMRLWVYYLPNIFDLPCFTATVADPDDLTSMFAVCAGQGCHPARQIALTRAVCEALQSRLSFIHGGRDDLVEHENRFLKMTIAEREQYNQQIIDKLHQPHPTINYGDIVDHAPQLQDLTSCWEILVQSLQRNGMDKICRVVYTQPTDPLQVVRILVPKLEFFSESTTRVGFRLRDHVQSRSKS